MVLLDRSIIDYTGGQQLSVLAVQDWEQPAADTTGMTGSPSAGGWYAAHLVASSISVPDEYYSCQLAVAHSLLTVTQCLLYTCGTGIRQC